MTRVRRSWEIALTLIAAASVFALYAVRFPPFEGVIFRNFTLPRMRACIDATQPWILKFISYNDHFGEAFVPWSVSWICGITLATLIAWRYARLRLPLLAGSAL